eukprot:10128421-Ditylum_brightwellii.AAC.1
MGDNKNATLHHDTGISNANSQDGIENSTVRNNALTPDKEEDNAISHISFDEEDNVSNTRGQQQKIVWVVIIII